MTHLPHENWNVQPADGPKYKVGPRCSVPDCGRLADHAHHLWRRSFLGKAADWVELWDGRVIGNLVGLCYGHHQLVTEGEAAILFQEEPPLFHWQEILGPTSLLTQQPPVGGELGLASRSLETQKLTADQEAAQSESCPTCGRRVRERPVVGSAALPAGPRRPRASWSIQVPVDEREDGAAVLDELCDGVMEAFGREEHVSTIARYFAVVEAFAFVLQHKHLLMREGA